MRKVLVVALGALALAGCVHHDGPYRGAGYGYGSYGYGYNTGYYTTGYGYRPAYGGHATDWERRAYWRARQEQRERWRHRWAYHD